MVPVRDVEIVKYLYPTYHGNSLDLKNFLQKLEPKIFIWPKVMNFFVYPMVKLQRLTDVMHVIFTIQNTGINFIVFISFAHR
jgi:hypothetical protein